MIAVMIPATLAAERGYGYRLLIETCLELPVEIIPTPNITHAEVHAGERILRIYCEPASKESLISRAPQATQVKETSLDDVGGMREPLPVIFMRPVSLNSDGPAIASGTKDLFFDIGLAAFFIASGAWELAARKKDERGRIAGKSSWLDDAGMLEKPVVEIYAKLLARLLFDDKKLGSYTPWNRLRMNVTCDVDSPFDAALYEPTRIAKRLMRNLGMERSLRACKDTVQSVKKIRADGWRADPNNTFEYMMELNERLGHQVGFYFICHRDGAIDASYDIFSPDIRTLMRRISERGHRLGIHGSYHSQYVPGKLKREASRFRHALKIAGCAENGLEGRQHYLRWDTAQGPDIVEHAGISKDLTLGFHDCVGFRRGLCRPFPLFALGTWRLTEVVEHPLIAMECAMSGSDLTPIKDPASCMNIFSGAANWCKAVNGEFVLLWHNSSLKTASHRELYEAVLAIR